MNSNPNNATTGAVAGPDWDEMAKPAVFVEDGVYGAEIWDARLEDSRLYPGKRYPRLMLIINDEQGRSAPASWIPYNQENMRRSILAVDPQFHNGQDVRTLIGKRCRAKVTLKKNLTVRYLLPLK
ncbi:hypothetical protein HQ590_14105 [bacterium]|nr:hypothetical protein [bacterium]